MGWGNQSGRMGLSRCGGSQRTRGAAGPLFRMKRGQDKISALTQAGVALREKTVNLIRPGGQTEDGAQSVGRPGKNGPGPALVIFGGVDISEVTDRPGRAGLARFAAGGQEVVPVRLTDQPKGWAKVLAGFDNGLNAVPTALGVGEAKDLLLGIDDFVGVGDDHEELTRFRTGARGPQ